ncbi:MAG: hypothetical protein AKCLJLPJ_02439 [Fimbriimonadales bacterium]|nr:MAG: hypothetical protein EDM73_09035 [Armatimonadota bacterium]MBV6504319.1 hypothetical protein [Fimbriimonadales bacterium]MCE7900483.1 hypothetical protein [Armatimonadetes bacterium ATM1]MDL1928373.1 hypothetical protein [Fimbriimonadia bacterium ATM]MBC6969074.1 hypothetical protein [Armatimonadota bacterium]
MKPLKTTVRTAVWWCLLGSLAASAAFAIISRSRVKGYDVEESVAKLREIGRALALYRLQYPPKPVDQRRTYSDAGLPPHILTLLEPGHPWSVQDGLRTFQVSRPNGVWVTEGSHYEMVYPSSYDKPSEHGSFAPLYSERGERLPVLFDGNMNDPVRIYEAPENLDVLILRLDGTVEPASWNRNIRWDVARR